MMVFDSDLDDGHDVEVTVSFTMEDWPSKLQLASAYPRRTKWKAQWATRERSAPFAFRSAAYRSPTSSRHRSGGLIVPEALAAERSGHADMAFLPSAVQGGTAS
jgi:hypothetical protein